MLKYLLYRKNPYDNVCSPITISEAEYFYYLNLEQDDLVNKFPNGFEAGFWDEEDGFCLTRFTRAKFQPPATTAGCSNNLNTLSEIRPQNKISENIPGNHSFDFIPRLLPSNNVKAVESFLTDLEATCPTTGLDCFTVNVGYDCILITFYMKTKDKNAISFFIATYKDMELKSIEYGLDISLYPNMEDKNG